MLHLSDRLVVVTWLVMIVPAFLWSSCRIEGEEESEDEISYMADYETPTEKWGFVDTTGQLAIPAIYDHVGFFSEGMAAVNMAGKWGYIDKAGELIIKPVFKSAWNFKEGMARVKPFGQNEHYINVAGKKIQSEEWIATGDFSESMALVRVGNAYGYIDTTGRLLIPANYTSGSEFNLGHAIVTFADYQGLINKKGEIVIDPSFDRIKAVQDTNLLICTRDGSSLIYDVNGDELLLLEGIKILDYTGSLMTIRKGEFVFFYDVPHREILPGKGFSNIIYLGEKRWAGRIGAQYFLYGSDGTKLSLKPYAQINRFVDGIAAYMKVEYWGYLDTLGNELTENVIALAWDYSEGFARTAFTEGMAYLDQKQQIPFYPPPGTIDMRDFKEGLAATQIAK